MDQFRNSVLDGKVVLMGRDINRLISNINIPLDIPSAWEDDFSITVFQKNELSNLSMEARRSISGITPHCNRVYPAGIIKDGIVYYLLIIWVEEEKEEVQLDVRDIIQNTFPKEPSTEFLDHLIYTLQLLDDHSATQSYSEQLVLIEHESDKPSSKGSIRLGDTALRNERYKLAMFSYAQGYEHASQNDEEKIIRYCLKGVERCSAYTEWGVILLEDEIHQIPIELSCLLLRPWSTTLQSAVKELNLIPSLCLEPRQRSYSPSLPSSQERFYRLPRYFRWIVPFCLSVMSTPRNEMDISALASIGIKTIITLTEETPLPAHWFQAKPIKNVFTPIPNYYPPSIEQMDIIIQLLNDETNLPLLVHCGGGKGRAGTVIACYLATYGFHPPAGDRDHPSMSANEAIAALRKIRPGSLETSQQEAFVARWCSTIWKRQSIFPERPFEPPPCKLIIEGTIEEDSNLFVLLGLPGSGKSWFSNALIARDQTGWKRINQDDDGSRTICETEISRTPLATNEKVLLDRCNTSSEDRKKWLRLASNWAINPVCIWFDYDKILCTSRAQGRIGHPTLRPGSRVRNATEQMDKIFDRPTLDEGFRGICVIRSFEASLELVERLSPRIGIHKFPRTPHLIDLGAATSDDIIQSQANSDATADPDDLASGGRYTEKVIITEKIDGANMGFSLSSDRSKIIVQNRSHYINPTSHEQFKRLGNWLEIHQAKLLRLLGQDESTDTFLDRQRLQSLLTLHDCDIHLVPIMEEFDRSPSDEQLEELVQRKSKFWEGRVEGIYVKWEYGGVVRKRGKVVRSDFIAGNEHWMKRKLEVNGIAVAGCQSSYT
ncbi:hypothetical protein I203_100187 [Kwoniella mangroviensis CBS 8507]|uniref:uncharacterized protein n=1 Tax=Kwoniella mangroviensis CBS 8507 TaxID=1296122 RepID=UPI00080CFE0F|nr:uncharacterized protein I203_08094 [Kwoniella mangroviensis CBS 8507]OCF62870.1 hypothetical protein I203_08094 [Kwoniella mangroviensis CBS 8507]